MLGVVGVVGSGTALALGVEARRFREETSVSLPLRAAKCAGGAPRGGREACVAAQPGSALGLPQGPASALSSATIPHIIDEDAAPRSCVVVGGGVVGVTTAYFLARGGFRVTLLERERVFPFAVSRGGPAADDSDYRLWDTSVELASASTLFGILVDDLGRRFRARFHGVKGNVIARAKGWLYNAMGMQAGSPWELARRSSAELIYGVGEEGAERAQDEASVSSAREHMAGGGGPAGFTVAAETAPSGIHEPALKLPGQTCFVDWWAVYSECLWFWLLVAAGALREAFGGHVASASSSSSAGKDLLRALFARGRDLVGEVSEEEGIDCGSALPGRLRVSSGPAGDSLVEHRLASAAVADNEGVDFVDYQNTLGELPYLPAGAHIRKALRCQQDIGDCDTFVSSLARVCRERYGVVFRTSADVVELYLDEYETPGLLVAQAKCKDGRRFDAGFFVLANGVGAAELARKVVNTSGTCPKPVCVPVCGFRGYSLALPDLRVPEALRVGLAVWPRVVLEPSKLMISAHPADCRMQLQAVHLASIAEVAAGGSKPNVRCAEALRVMAKEALPCLCVEDLGQAKVLCHRQRPRTPDDLPIVSGTRYPNLFLNTGHGDRAWHFSCAAGETLSCLMTGGFTSPIGTVGTEHKATPPVDACQLSLKRFSALFGMPPQRGDFPEFSRQLCLAQLRAAPRSNMSDRI